MRGRSLILILCATTALFGASSVLAGRAVTPYGSSFETTLTGKSAQLNGMWVLSFAADGSYTVAKAPQKTVLIAGSSTIAGHTLTLVDKTGPASCTGSQARGVYSWTMKGTSLRLKPTLDTCIGRATVLGTSAFTKVG